MTASPLTSVLDALRAGAVTRSSVAARTGLDVDVVDASVDHLLRLGLVGSLPTSTLCASGSCGGCALSDPCSMGG